MKAEDNIFMQLAIDLAKRGEGKTFPNPIVGAVIVKNGRIIGTGYHKKAGMPHAEIMALRQAGKKARGATMYVTLEPCNTFGRTPPCAPEIIKYGIKKVVIASKDPNPVNHNNGIKLLKEYGIKVESGLLAQEAYLINRPYNKYISEAIPYVTVKYAMSIDGKIATKTGSSKWITSSKSRIFVKQLRKKVDAVLVGHKTFLKDHPKLHGVKNKIILGKGRANLKKTLKGLAKKGVVHVLIEGGGETIASAIRQKLVDDFYIFIAPKIIGGRNAITPVEGNGIKNISEAIDIKITEIKTIGKDILIKACLRE